MRKMGVPARKTDRHFTYGDYRQWPEDERWELIDGVAYAMSPAPNVYHQGLVVELGRQIANYLQGRPCRVFWAPVDVFLPASPDMEEDEVDTVVQPDLLVVCEASKIRLNGIWGAPDLVIEILSPWTQKKDLAEKFAAYERAGVREYWTVDPGNKSLVMYLLEAGKDGRPRYGAGRVFERGGRASSTAVAGLEIDLDKAFKVLGP